MCLTTPILLRRLVVGANPIDGVIVGMYPRYHDQISENASLVRQFGIKKDT